MRAGEITVELRLVDHVSKPLRRLSWKFQSWDGQWHPSYLKADGLRQPVKSEVEAALVAVERNRP